MGRRPKHFTKAEKAAAHRESNKRYSQAPNAKVVRALSNRAHYLSHTSRHEYPQPLRCIPDLPALPRQIHDLYHQPLPESEGHYEDALADASYLDRSDKKWLEKPPFEQDDDTGDPYSSAYRRFTDNLKFALDGDRMRRQQEAEHHRRTELDINGWAASLTAWREEVQHLLRDWEEVKDDMYDSYHASRHYVMHHSYLQWQARTIYRLYYLLFLE
ncbi:hypothetical protein B0H12DRAFT_1242575 [Mycena haematopus]|nr:hypothetical protein B0H12DRAFT_1242575 [Mycena haematopus]